MVPPAHSDGTFDPGDSLTNYRGGQTGLFSWADARGRH